MNLNRTILLDCDGVLLNWADSFVTWMSGKGYKTYDEHYGDYGLHKWFNMSEDEIHKFVAEFNSSSQIGFLPQIMDASEALNILKEDGYRFKVITSMSDNCYSQQLRTANLINIFGYIFDEIVYLPLRACKKEELQRQKNMFGPHVATIWIDDHIYNAEVGLELGFETIVFGQLHNRKWDGNRASDWVHALQLIKDIEAEYAY